MKRTALRRKIGLKRGTKIRVAGKSEASEVKRNIQALLRQIVIKRDGGCILRNVRHCGGDIGFAVLQAGLHPVPRTPS